MNLKRFLLGGIVLALAILGVYYSLNLPVGQAACTRINSMNGIDNCAGNTIDAVGILECVKPGVPGKAGVHYLKFSDGTELRFLQEYADCSTYGQQKVTVTGELYQCKQFDQCSGVGLTDIKSVIPAL